jgi:hypothetical protein
VGDEIGRFCQILAGTDRPVVVRHAELDGEGLFNVYSGRKPGTRDGFDRAHMKEEITGT